MNQTLKWVIIILLWVTIWASINYKMGKHPATNTKMD